MKRVLLLLLLALPVSLFAQSGQGGSFSVRLKGKVIGSSQTKNLYIMEVGNRSREIDRNMVIPVKKDGEFDFEFKGKEVKAYEVMDLAEFQKGSFRYMIFFPDAPVVELEFHQDYDKDKAIGGELNKTYSHYKKSSKEIGASSGYIDLDQKENEMYKNGTLFNQQYKELEKELLADQTSDERVDELISMLEEMRNDGSGYTDAGRELMEIGRAHV